MEIDNIRIEAYGDDFDLVVYAKFTDPNPNQILSQEYDYPMVVVKTDLKEMPKSVHLDVEYLNK